MPNPKEERLSDAANSIDIGLEAYNDLLALMREQPGRRARITIAGYG